MEVTLDGERLTAAEIRELLAKSDGLALVRGRWVEVDRERLSRMMEHFREVERTAARERPRLSPKPCGCSPAPMSPPATPPRMRRRRLGAGGRRSLAGGDAERAAQPGGLGPNRSRRGAERHAAALPAGGRALALSPRASSASGPAWPTTWGSARPSRCWRCCSCSSARRPANRQPSLLVAPGFAAGQLGVGDRALRAGFEGAHRASVRAAGRRAEDACARAAAAMSTW